MLEKELVATKVDDLPASVQSILPDIHSIKPSEVPVFSKSTIFIHGRGFDQIREDDPIWVGDWCIPDVKILSD